MYNKTKRYFWLFLALLLTMPVINIYADGSKDLYPSEKQGRRAFLRSSNTATVVPCEELNIFWEDFGTSNFEENLGRTTSPYMPPSESFTFGTPYPQSNVSEETAIDNDHYAVVAPGYIKLGWQTNDLWYYFWTPLHNEANTVTDRSNTKDETGNVPALQLITYLNERTKAGASIEISIPYIDGGILPPPEFGDEVYKLQLPAKIERNNWYVYDVEI